MVCVFLRLLSCRWRAESRIDMRLSADIIIWRRVIHCAVCFLALTAPCYWAKSNFHPLSYILVKNIEFVTWCDPVTEACRTYTPSQTQFRLNRFQVGKGVSNQETCMDYFVLSGKSCENLNLKFIYSEKATKFWEIFTLPLFYVVPVKSKVKILENCVAFSEYMNFT